MENLSKLTPEQIGEKILNSNDWLVIRYVEEEGIHVHVNNDKSISLIPILLAADINLYDYLKDAVEKIKSINKDGDQL